MTDGGLCFVWLTAHLTSVGGQAVPPCLTPLRAHQLDLDPHDRFRVRQRLRELQRDGRLFGFRPSHGHANMARLLGYIQR